MEKSINTSANVQGTEAQNVNFTCKIFQVNPKDPKATEFSYTIEGKLFGNQLKVKQLANVISSRLIKFAKFAKLNKDLKRKTIFKVSRPIYFKFQTDTLLIDLSSQKVAQELGLKIKPFLKGEIVELETLNTEISFYISTLMDSGEIVLNAAEYIEESEIIELPTQAQAN